MTRARVAEDLEELSDCFSRLETDIDSFSAVLSRLSDARKGTTRQRPVAGSRAQGRLPELQRKRTSDDAATTTLGLGLGRTEELSGSPTGSLAALSVLAIATGTTAALCLWGMRQKVGRIARDTLNSTRDLRYQNKSRTAHSGRPTVVNTPQVE